MGWGILGWPIFPMPEALSLEPVTHFMTGALIGRAGFNRRTAYATFASVLAAEAADIDVFWSMASPADALRYHRGITHTIWASPVLAAAVCGVVWLMEKLLSWWQLRRHPQATRKPIGWLWLYASAFVATLSHLFLDWTNNYGIRLLYPFDRHWRAGSIVFIVEPLELALLLAALLFPALLGLVEGEIGARRKHPRGQLWALVALVGMACLIELRWAEHRRALHLVEQTQIAQEPVTRTALEPYPLNPFRWHLIAETPSTYVTGEINTLSGAIDGDPERNSIPKPRITPAIVAARQSDYGQAYTDWGSWAVLSDLGPVAIPGLEPPVLPPSRHWTTVHFTDLRFGYSFLGPDHEDARRSGLGRSVYVIDDREVIDPVHHSR